MNTQFQNNLLDFTGHKLFIGIDIHLKSWVVTIRTKEIELKTFSMNPSPQELSTYLNKHYPNAEFHSVYEAGFCGFWTHRELTQLGIHNIVTNPADVPTKHKEKDQKTDPVDSRKLARELSKDSLDKIYIPSKKQEAMRALSRLRIQITKRNTQIKNRIKQFLYFKGINVPHHSEISHWSGAFIHWLKNIKFSESNDRYYLDSLLNDLEYQRKEKCKLMRCIRKIAQANQTIKYLRTVKGVGLITAFTFFAEIMDIHRFHKFDQLTSFLGLAPSTASSGPKDKTLGLTNRHNKYLRYMLVESAWIATRKDPALTLAFSTLIKSKTKQKAIIKITKKLVNRMRYVWKNQTEYVCAVV